MLVAAVRAVELRGTSRFSGAERLVRDMVAAAPGGPGVAPDLTLVRSLDDVARRMPPEVARRPTLDGHEGHPVDPENAVPGPGSGDGGRATVVGSVEEIVRRRVWPTERPDTSRHISG